MTHETSLFIADIGNKQEERAFGTGTNAPKNNRTAPATSVVAAARVSNISTAHGNAANPPTCTMRDITLVAHPATTGVLACDAA